MITFKTNIWNLAADDEFSNEKSTRNISESKFSFQVHKSYKEIYKFFFKLTLNEFRAEAECHNENKNPPHFWKKLYLTVYAVYGLFQITKKKSAHEWKWNSLEKNYEIFHFSFFAQMQLFHDRYPGPRKNILELDSN